MSGFIPYGREKFEVIRGFIPEGEGEICCNERVYPLRRKEKTEPLGRVYSLRGGRKPDAMRGFIPYGREKFVVMRGFIPYEEGENCTTWEGSLPTGRQKSLK